VTQCRDVTIDLTSVRANRSSEQVKGFTMRCIRAAQFRMTFRWVTLCLMLISLVGCQSMVKGKSKAKAPLSQDKFSCGEPLPGRQR
jgi:hypothetical protein